MDTPFNIDELFSKIESTVDQKLEAFLYSYYYPIKKDLTNEKQIQSSDQLFETKKSEVKSALREANKQLDRFKSAVHLFTAHKNEFLSAEEIKRFDHEMEMFHERFKNFKPEHAALEKSHSIKEILGVSDFILYCYYLVGFNLFQKGSFTESSQLFFFVAVFNPLVKDYWMALGLAERNSKQYEAAAHAFGMAALLDKADPNVKLSLVECFIELKNTRNAEEQLAFAETIIHQNNHHEALKSDLIKLRSDVERLKTRSIK